jgi:hypothetical protein
MHSPSAFVRYWLEAACHSHPFHLNALTSDLAAKFPCCVQYVCFLVVLLRIVDLHPVVLCHVVNAQACQLPSSGLQKVGLVVQIDAAGRRKASAAAQDPELQCASTLRKSCELHVEVPAGHRTQAIAALDGWTSLSCWMDRHKLQLDSKPCMSANLPVGFAHR